MAKTQNAFIKKMQSYNANQQRTFSTFLKTFSDGDEETVVYDGDNYQKDGDEFLVSDGDDDSLTRIAVDEGDINFEDETPDVDIVDDNGEKAVEVEIEPGQDLSITILGTDGVEDKEMSKIYSSMFKVFSKMS